jgi:hypothetical protein
MSTRAQSQHLTPRLLSAAGVGATTFLIAACGAGTRQDSNRAAAAARRGDQAMIQFAGCMRAHGIAMADPFHRPGHSGLSIDLPEQGPATAAADRSCGHYLEPIIQEKQAHARAVTAADRLQLIRYAQCMRRRGIAMLDPSPQGALSLGTVPGIGAGFGRYSPQFHAADNQCRALLPPDIHDDGTGP